MCSSVASSWPVSHYWKQHLKPDDELSKRYLCAMCSSVASSWPVGHYWKELKCWEKFTIPSQPNPYSITEPTWWIMHTNLEMKQPLLCALEDFQRDMSYLGAPLFWSFRRNIWKNASLSLIRYVYRVFGIPQQVHASRCKLKLCDWFFASGFKFHLVINMFLILEIPLKNNLNSYIWVPVQIFWEGLEI